MSSRRQFLTSATAGSLTACVAGPLLSISPLTAADTKVTPQLVQLKPEIEPLVRLIEQTPRAKCFDMMVGQLKGGLPYRNFLAGLFLAGLRNVSPQPPGFKFHCVFVIHAAHQLSLDAPVQDRLLPLFWALDNFKASQQRDVEEGDFQLQPVSGKLPSATTAWREFHAAMDEWDEPKADRAIATLVRSRGAQEIVEQLWQYGARDYRNIGHKAIFVANTWRTLQTIGWRHAEPALRSLVLGLLDFGKSERVNRFAFEDQSYLPNVQLAAANHQLLATVPAKGKDATAAVRFLEGMRTGKAAETCKMAIAALKSHAASASQIWDAVHLAACELMMRQPGIYGIHTVTSVSALRYAYEQAATDKTRLLMLLQGIGWMCQFREFMETKGLQPVRINDLEGGSLADTEQEAANEIMAEVGRNAGGAAAKALVYARQYPQATALMRTAQGLILRKATDAHDYKYATSIFADYRQVDPAWRPHLLATSTYYLRGTGMPNSPVLKRAAAAIAKL